jgi:hypothetical protein
VLPTTKLRANKSGDFTVVDQLIKVFYYAILAKFMFAFLDFKARV